MKYLFGEQKKIERKIKQAKSILLVCDFDGTLVTIKPTPKLARLPAKTKKLLSLLSRNRKYNVGIISGRSLSDIRKLIGLNSIFYAGNHGLEIKLPKSQKFVYSQARQTKPLIQKLSKEFDKLSSGYKGLFIENKIYTLSIHYRNCPAGQIPGFKKDVRRICFPLINKRKIRVTEGKKVIEIVPPLAWDKGKALCWIKDRLKANKALTIYIGDDRTDEDAFTQIKRGLSVYVGEKKEHSSAKFYLRHPNQVVYFLTLLIKLENGKSKQSK